MENQVVSKIQKSFSGLLTRDNLYTASTLIGPLVLLVFLPLVSVFVLTMLALFGLSIAMFHIRKERDSCRHYLKICKDLLEKLKKETSMGTKKENKQIIENPDAILSITPSSD